MKSGNRYILYIFLAILIGAGLALYLLRQQAATFLSDSAGVSGLAITGKAASPSKDALDTSLLTDSKFLSLKNNINKFDFNSICKTPVGRMEIAATSSDGTVSTSTQSISCVLGNNLPFPLPVKTK